MLWYIPWCRYSSLIFVVRDALVHSKCQIWPHLLKLSGFSVFVSKWEERVLNVSWEDPKQSVASVSLINYLAGRLHLSLKALKLLASRWLLKTCAHSLCLLVSFCLLTSQWWVSLVKHSPLFRVLSRTPCYLMFFWSWLLRFIHHNVVIKL